MLASDTELGTPSEIFVFGNVGGLLVDADVEEVHSPLVFLIVAANIGRRAEGLDHDGNPVKLGVAGMKNVTRHFMCLRP
jgi:hypothetical protein